MGIKFSLSFCDSDFLIQCLKMFFTRNGLSLVMSHSYNVYVGYVIIETIKTSLSPIIKVYS